MDCGGYCLDERLDQIFHTSHFLHSKSAFLIHFVPISCWLILSSHFSIFRKPSGTLLDPRAALSFKCRRWPSQWLLCGWSCFFGQKTCVQAVRLNSQLLHDSQMRRFDKLHSFLLYHNLARAFHRSINLFHRHCLSLAFSINDNIFSSSCLNWSVCQMQSLNRFDVWMDAECRFHHLHPFTPGTVLDRVYIFITGAICIP